MTSREGFDASVEAHDAAVRDLGADIWVGSEPTFTDRWSTLPEWTRCALGEDKARRALDIVGAIQDSSSGALVLRTIGRQYPGEERARWSYGLFRRRDERPCWHGPPDPLLQIGQALGNTRLGELCGALRSSLAAHGFAVWEVPQATDSERRLVFRLSGSAPPDWTDPRLLRPSIHSRAIPKTGLRDDLALEGLCLVILSDEAVDDGTVARIDLPGVGDVPTFLNMIAAIGRAAAALALPAVILAGFPPPVDASVEWATVTPDPAVIEINMAPDGSARAFLERSRLVYGAAAAQGLSPYRFYFNGTVADSGGGGQITLGGPSPGASPFFVEYRLLPRLIRYVHAHPSLSYLFAHDYVGASGQSVRTDERGDDAFRELHLALALLDRSHAPTPEILWRSLAPFLTDPVGNAHRSELNIEKLWNPFLSGRGQLGLLEFRAFRMQHTPERAAALVCLLRAVVAMLMHWDPAGPLQSWGCELHERFALPFCLESDLLDVLGDLAANRLRLGEPLVRELLRDEFREQAETSFCGVRLRIRRAVEFWPLVGDASSQEGETSRLVDSSTQRLEVMLQPDADDEPQFAGWQLRVDGVDLPLHEARWDGRPVKVFGLRYRSFVPWQGLHPTLDARERIVMYLHHAAHDKVCELGWHEWRPATGPYPGLPRDAAEARERRVERLLNQALERAALPTRIPAPDGSLTPWSLDLRWL